MQKVLPFLLQTLLFLSAITFVYFFFSNSSKNSAKLLDDLLQERIAIAAFVKLDPLSEDFSQEKDNILITIDKSNANGLKIAGGKAKAIFAKQRKGIDQIKHLDSKIAKIFVYDPQTDLKSSSSNSDLIERLGNAKNGLSNIQKRLGKNDGEKLIEEITNTQNLCQSLISKLQRYQVGRKEAADEFIKRFNTLKKAAFAKETSFLTSEDALKNLTEQSNLILDLKSGR